MWASALFNQLRCANAHGGYMSCSTCTCRGGNGCHAEYVCLIRHKQVQLLCGRIVRQLPAVAGRRQHCIPCGVVVSPSHHCQEVPCLHFMSHAHSSNMQLRQQLYGQCHAAAACLLNT
jgi:hypothetical protein